MGNQPSRNAGAKSAGNSDSLKAFPPMGKTDTEESSRSFRSSIRSKIPGSTLRVDSPRDTTSAAGSDSNTTSTANTAPIANNGTSNTAESPSTSRLHRRNKSTPSDPTTPIDSTPSDTNDSDSASHIPSNLPPSPVSNSVRQGHKDISGAQASGEIDKVSDLLSSAVDSLHAHTRRPGKSILLARDSQASTPSQANGGSVGAVSSSTRSEDTVAISDIKDIDLDDYIRRLHDAGYAGKVTKSVCLKNAEITAICKRASEVFLSQPALLELDAPVKIVGDVHGQYTDVIRLFEMCGFPPASNFLFLGDYVDRGKQSLETILLLLCYKIKFPENFFLLRGNHECANVTRVYGFYDECKRRCNVKIWKQFVDCFNTLPIAAIVAGKIFCVHGGLSPSLTHMDDIRNIARPTDVPDFGLLNDLLWSDPAEMDADWKESERGVSYFFGKGVITKFLNDHDFDLVCRAHMVVEDGYEFFNERVLVTVFSAPNYCGEFDNWGAVMSVSSELLCSFELLKPLDSSALKSHIKKGRSKRQHVLNSPPATVQAQSV